MELRDYQVSAVESIHEKLKTNKSTLLVLATGLGKTVTFSKIAADYLNVGRIMVLAHRGELIHQAANTLKKITGIEPEIEMGENHSGFGFEKSKIIVGTIQTQKSGMAGKGRMTKFNPHEFSLVIIDESHHSAAKSYLDTIRYYRQNPNLKVLGVTATPDRLDEKALGKVFDSVAYEYGILDGINDGWLVPINQHAVYVKGLDYSKIKTVAGDFNQGELAKVLEEEQNLHEIAIPTVELTKNRKSLIFAASVEQAGRLAEVINRYKQGSADMVCGVTEETKRRETFKAFENGDLQYLVNVGIATEGYDCPGIGCIVMARPTKSRSLYAQMLGRGTRALPGIVDGLATASERKQAISASGKPCIEVFDFVGNAGKHKLITTADILGDNLSDEVVERAKKNIEKKGEGNVLDELAIAEQQLLEEKRKEMERAARLGITAGAKWSVGKINPFDILQIEPRRAKGWDRVKKPSDKMIAMLDRNGIPVEGIGFTQAQQLVSELFKRREQDLCSFKQAKLLSRYGYDTHKIGFKEASALIDQLAKNNWKRVS